ncbi:MAG: hypothetical protein FWC66_07795 [Oscillospiraceae bacterium]|nr:hypothetical protein [Oscillospiraceae bacterium]
MTDLLNIYKQAKSNDWRQTSINNECPQWRINKINGLLREVSIKEGLPTVNDAIKRVTYNIKNAEPMGVSAIKLIHGYGSTGKGGGIRTETRRYLERLKNRKEINDFITGEKFSIFDESTRKAFLVCDGLRRDSDLERHNNGITIVIL